MGRTLFVGNAEPEINDVLSDPIIHLIMSRDGLCAEDLLKVIAKARALLQLAAPEERAA